MLTGDLGHTAQEIGYNCGVLSRDVDSNDLFKLESVDHDQLTSEVLQLSDKIKQSKLS